MHPQLHDMLRPGHWIVCPQPRPKARQRLFCFPHAGVGTSVFRGWAQELNADAEVCLLQLPGREGRLREQLPTAIRELTPAIAEAMSDLLDRPFAFYGHSLGATIAFETALQLREMSLAQPFHLFVGASPAPQLPWEHPHLRTLSENEFLSEVQRRYGGLPREVISDAEMRALLLPILRADVAMIETYSDSANAPLSCDITAFGGRADSMVKPGALEAWREQTTGRFRMQMLDGDHLFLRSNRTKLMRSIANELQTTCEEAIVFRQDS